MAKTKAVDAVSKFESMDEDEQAGGSPVEQDDKERERWMMDDGIPIVSGLKDGQPAEVDLYMDDLLSRGRGYLREYLRNREVFRQRHLELVQWLESVQGPLEKKMNWLEGLIVAAARFMQFPGKAKSRSLPNGVIGRRAVAARVEVLDRERAVAFAKKNKIPGAIKEDVYKKPLVAFAISKGGKLPEDSGLVFQPKDEKGRLYWKTPEHAELKAKGDAEGEDDTGE